MVCVGADSIQVEEGDSCSGDRRCTSPYSALPPGEEARGHESEDTEVEKVRCEEGGKGIVEVAPWLVGTAKLAICQDIRPILKVE